MSGDTTGTGSISGAEVDATSIGSYNTDMDETCEDCGNTISRRAARTSGMASVSCAARATATERTTLSLNREYPSFVLRWSGGRISYGW